MPSLNLPCCRVKLSPVTCSLGEEARPHLATTSCQGVVESESNIFGLVKKNFGKGTETDRSNWLVWIDSYVVRIVSVHDALALQSN